MQRLLWRQGGALCACCSMQLKTPMDWISPITPTWPVCHGQTEKMRLEPALLLLVWAVGSQAVCERFLVPSPRGRTLTALLNIPAACKQGGWFWNRGLLVAYSLNYLIQGAQIPAVGLALELFLRKYFWALSWASCICKLFILVPCSHCTPCWEQPWEWTESLDTQMHLWQLSVS